MRWTIYHGDALDELKKIPDKAVHTCITSPPYYDLRSYLPGVVRLRDDLTDEELACVEAELKKRGILPVMG